MINLVQTSQEILNFGWIPIFEIFTNLSRNESDIESQKLSLMLLNMFTQQIESLVLFVLPKPSCCLSLCIQLMKSQDKNISGRGGDYFNQITTIFQQVLKLQIEEESLRYRLEEEKIRVCRD